MTTIDRVLCWLNRPRLRVRTVVDTVDGPLLDLACPACGKDHS